MYTLCSAGIQLICICQNLQHTMGTYHTSLWIIPDVDNCTIHLIQPRSVPNEHRHYRLALPPTMHGIRTIKIQK